MSMQSVPTTVQFMATSNNFFGTSTAYALFLYIWIEEP
ncbi:hypothetical protein ATK78_0124 [Pedobacter metabolipauper]|uniref:Uncharacterized protein n=1 Tax=Pedobacter metabolipauper TaxID=425513 RepID=A0A4R6T0K2_9SPHI|nr:hypothetical protein ATK78_0124 [Pedobacter metabolipauper]